VPVSISTKTYKPQTRQHNHPRGVDAPATGLGIDAGGTYTDAVILDFGRDSILAKAKALTTKWDYTEGIEDALEKLPRHHLEKVSLVSVSTTLATNAIVEKHGQKVGLLLMPPYGLFREAELAHAPMAVVQGQMDMDGTVLAPVDPAEIETVARAMVAEHGVRAFAVSGCAATVNAAHEIEVAHILHETTGLGVTCGHTLSDMLGVNRRATTAIFNARVVPFIEAFLQDLQRALTKRLIDAPVMVVKGDGTLMSADMARERPVETIFSGPAASVAGARRLTRLANALVVDIGGTTTDIAAIRGNRVEICSKGNVVAGVHTHVRALDMSTRGLGGDSAITISGRDLRIGPTRVIPVSCLATKFPGTAEALDSIEADPGQFRSDTSAMQLLAPANHTESLPLDPVEKAILGVLAIRPHSIEELARVLELPYGGIGLSSRLLRHNMITLSALTPTDLLHARGRVALWDADTARRVCHIHAGLMNMPPDAFVGLALDTLTRELALEIFRKVMSADVDPTLIDASGACRAILRKWLDPADHDLAVSMMLPFPLVGVGAPAGELLPEVAKLLNTDCVIPGDFDVANAIGAITSTISVSRSIRVAPRESGRYAIQGLAEGREFDDLGEAVEIGKALLEETVCALAHRAGLLNPAVEITLADDTVVNGYGCEHFLGTIVTASVNALPDTAPAD
jgi:N-methylhydantoinase A/oxoprolinase/acetone carboxylase beta subunit